MRPLIFRLALLAIPLLAVSLLAHGKSKPGSESAAAITPAPAATPAVNVWERQQAIKLAKKFDKNKNGKIDLDEVDALRREFAAKPDGFLKFYDTNHDGKLDDVEVDAIKLPAPKEEKKKKHKSKPLFGEVEVGPAASAS